MRHDFQVITKNELETYALGQNLAHDLLDNSILCLFGDLGAGKTTFVKGVASVFCRDSFTQVNSPTFTFLNIYPGKKNVYHFDLYRLKSVSEFLDMGFDEMLFSNGICCIEWSERIATILPDNIIKIEIDILDHNVRQFRILNEKN